MSAWWSRHRQCMKILVRQECGRERCEEQLEELKEKLREETKRRIEAEAKVTRLLDITHSITRGTRVEELDLVVANLSVKCHVLAENAKKHDEEMRAMVEEKNELKISYDELTAQCKRLREDNTSWKEKCDNYYGQLEKLHLERLKEGLQEMLRLQGMEDEEFLQESLQETATGSSRAEESSVLSCEEAANSKDQEGSDSVPMPLNHLPEPVDLLGKTTEQHRMEDEESLQETAVGASREEAAEESSVLSSEEVLHPADQEEPDSVPTPLNQFPELLEQTMHTGVNLLSSSFLPFGLRAGWLQAKAAAN